MPPSPAWLPNPGLPTPPHRVFCSPGPLTRRVGSRPAPRPALTSCHLSSSSRSWLLISCSCSWRALLCGCTAASSSHRTSNILVLLRVERAEAKRGPRQRPWLRAFRAAPPRGGATALARKTVPRPQPAACTPAPPPPPPPLLLLPQKPKCEHPCLQRSVELYK